MDAGAHPDPGEAGVMSTSATGRGALTEAEGSREYDARLTASSPWPIIVDA